MASDSRPPASQPITAPPSSSIPQTPQNPETTAATAAAHHHHHPGDETCACGRPLPLWTHSPPPPNNTYRPLRAPAISAPSNSQSIILSPVPHAEHVPLLSPPYLFVTPVKQIRSPEDIAKFHTSPSGRNFVGFVVALSESVRGQKISHPCLVSPVVQSILDSLDYLGNCVDEIPPLPQNSRYGNLAYREWNARMSKSKHLMDGVLGEGLVLAAEEVFPYFTDSFGNTTRIDYGTGHETNFAAWLYCLARLGVLKEEDYPAVVRRVFVKYLDLMRKLQTTYWLEPAGSHGVWGLDDYHFLPFVFGASQLVDHKYMKPKSIHNDDILENYSGEYMYLACVKFVKKVKKGHMAEHSPMLDDISGVPNWGKVHSGMLKMYKAEVLEKVPIMQHFLFGSIIKWEV